MRELQKKEHFRRAMYSLPTLIILGLITFILAKGAVNIVLKEQESREKAAILKEEMQALVLREEMLRGKIAYLQTPKGLEDEIKDKFSVVPEGEHVAIIVDQKLAATSTDLSEVSWYRKIWSAIMGDQ